MVVRNGLILSTGCAGAGALRGAGQGQLPPVPLPGPPGMSYKAICIWLLLVLALEVPRIGQVVNQDWLPLQLGLGPLSKRRGMELAQVRIYLFKTI